MSKLKAFLKGSALEAVKEVEFKVSDRFVNENGEVEKFLLRILGPNEITKVQDSGLIVKGKDVKFKSDVMQLNLAVATTKEPDLMNKELQDSYGVTTPHDLLTKMLTGPEYLKLIQKAMKINGLSESLDEKVDEVKN